MRASDELITSMVRVAGDLGRQTIKRGSPLNELLQSSGKAICSLLETWLPRLGGDWWKDCVIQRLTFQQQRSVEDRRIATLTALDFAALLRVLDQNWHEIAAVHRLPREARTWLKEPCLSG